MNSYLSLLAWVINTGSLYINKISNTVRDVYLVLTVIPDYVIGPSGQIFSTNMFEIMDHTTMWHYENGCLYKDDKSACKRSNLLSCEFVYKGESISMDDFLENSKFFCEDLSFAVLMAAFTIYTKKIYHWENSEFIAFTCDGKSVTFNGSSVKFVKDIGADSELQD